MTDQQQGTISPEEDFRSELVEVFAGLEFDVANGAACITAERGGVCVRRYRDGSTRVDFGTVSGHGKTIIAAATRAKVDVSEAVAALQSVGWEVSP